MAIRRQEERLGSLQLVGQLRRILSFVRDRRWLLITLMLFACAQAALELSLPLIVRAAVDGHIQAPWVRVDPDLGGPDWSIDRPPTEAAKDGRHVFARRVDLSEARLRALRARGALERKGWVRASDGRFVSAAELGRLSPARRTELRSEDVHGVINLALIYLGALLLIFGLAYGVTYGLNHLGQTAVLRIRVRVMEHMLNLPVRTFDENPVGRLATRLANDPANLSELFTSVVTTAPADVVMFIGILSLFFWLDPATTLWLLLVAPALFGLTLWFKRVSQRIHRKIRERLAALNSWLQESYSGLVVLRSFAYEPDARDRFDELNQSYYRSQVKLINVFAVFRPAVDAFSTLALGLVVWYAGGQTIQDRISLGTLVAFLLYLKMLFRPLQSLADKFNILQSSVVSSERLLRMLDQPAEPSGTRSPAQADEAGIVFKDVHFAYEEGQQVLNGVSFSVEPGQKVALVGPSGSGKTTAIALLLGFYPLGEGAGRIQVDGIDIKDWDLASLRRRFSIVQQDLFLYAGSLRDNVGLFSEPDPERLDQALRVSRLGRILERLPDGLDHRLNERGTVLSQGERQLVSFARALAHGGSILVLDEATSAVDSATESLIEEALEDLLRDRTALVVAHRLSTVQSADRILVLHHGRVVEQGSHQELMKADGLYAQLYRTQQEGA